MYAQTSSANLKWGIGDQKQFPENPYFSLMKLRMLVVIFLLSAFMARAQQDPVMDSLYKALAASAEDTNKVWVLNELSWELLNNGDYDTALALARNGKTLAEEINFSTGVSSSLNKMGLIYFNLGEFAASLEHHLLALDIREKTGDLPGQASSHNNIGNIFNRQGDYAKALHHYTRCLKIKEQLGDKKGMTNSLNNIGSMYHNQREYSKALSYYLRAVDVSDYEVNSPGLADLHNNIGTLFSDMGNNVEALVQHNYSLKMRRELGDKEGVAVSCINLADITMRSAWKEGTAGERSKRITESRNYLSEALALSREIRAKDLLMDTYGLLASLDSAQGNWKEAYTHHHFFLLYRDSIDSEENTKKMVEAEMNFKFSKTQAALQAEQVKKDLTNAVEARKQKMILWFTAGGLLFALVFAVFVYRSYRQKQQSARIIEKKNVELERLSLAASETDNVILILSPEGKVEWANESFTRVNGITIDELKKRKGETIFEISNSTVIRKVVDEALTGKRSVVYESLNVNKEGKRIWESSTLTPIFDEEGELRKMVIIDTDITKRKEAEEIISLRNKDITDSINYAQRIQGALLIPESQIKKEFSDAFVLFRPKDIVSGDFYWFAESKHNKILAVADCTGHGVPGGFMSMLGFAMLQENMLHEDVKTTGDALQALDQKITDTLNRNDRSNRDGMDMVLCAFSKSEPKLQFSCANRPLVRIRNREIKEFRGDKFPVGGAIDDASKLFQSIDIDLEKGDLFYLFSDGYADQFGGARQKKFMYKRLLETLLSVSDQPLDIQKKMLNDTFDSWRSSLEQVDDVLVIGIRI